MRAVATTAMLVCAWRPPAVSAASLLDGRWTGSVDALAAHGVASGMLAQSKRRVAGTITLDVGALSATFPVRGRVRAGTAVVSGKQNGRRLRWRGRWSAKEGGWRGTLVVRGGGLRLRGMLLLMRGADVGPRCGSEYFAGTVMPVVVEPICARCHVPGGQAQAAAFRVTLGDPGATAASAAGMVDVADPAASRLLAKPRGDVPHGGGRRIAPGSPEEQALVTWIGLVTAPGCQDGSGGSGGGGGGGGGGGAGPGSALYAANCASCHGADARGLDGSPDIHCQRDIHDAVRKGRTGGPLGDMPSFPSLSEQDIVEIQSFLGSLCPTDAATGAELYASNCETCHGSDAAGSANAPSVRCATRADDALIVGRGARMPAFPAFTSAERERIGTFLAERCAAAGRTGADLYAGNCASCHGATGGGGRNGLGVAGPDIRCTEAGDYREKIRFGDDGMPAFGGITASDVTAIQTHLTTGFCSSD